MEQWGRLSHLFVTVVLANFPTYLVTPAITDVTVAAVCGGKEECSLAIYLTGLQQAIIGLGSMVVTPLIGNLSDTYGRKKLLAIPMTLQIIPLAILAWNRTTNFFYAYYVFKILTDMVVIGGILCLALSYLADNVGKTKRIVAFAVLNGVMCGTNVCGTLAASLLSISHIFQVATIIAVLAAVYMILFLKDSPCENDKWEPLVLTSEIESCQPEKLEFIHQIPSPEDLLLLFKSSPTFALAASVCFFNGLAEAGALSFLTYYLKYRFHFDKDQFSFVFLVTNLGATVTNVLLMPLYGHFIGEEKLLAFALFNGFLNMFLQSIAWSTWVPYFASLLAMFFSLSSPCIRSIISKQVGPNEQGLSQGCLLAIAALANIISPLIYSPLSALFLSDGAPFNFPGFCMLCIGFAYIIGLILSLMIIKTKSPSQEAMINNLKSNERDKLIISRNSDQHTRLC